MNRLSGRGWGENKEAKKKEWMGAGIKTGASLVYKYCVTCALHILRLIDNYFRTRFCIRNRLNSRLPRELNNRKCKHNDIYYYCY